MRASGNQAIEKTYNQYGIPLNFKANSGVIQNLSFEFELKTGNLTRRTGHQKGKYEYFTYDDINRLTSAQTGNIGAALSGALQSYTFADNGNITSKTGIGAYKYDPVKLHAVVEVENTTAVIPTISQFITYSAFQQPMTITEGTNVLTYTYSADYQRIKGVLSGNAGAVLNKRYYFGDFERDITGAVTRDIHYIGGDGLNCIIEKVGTNVSYYYVYKDYLGSILTVTNSTGSIVQEQNFDAWGKDRNTTDWTYNNIAPSNLSWLTRGYTGHEHLVQFSLINMNGRLYDPILGRMLSPDNYTQGSSQGYNRYTYAMNNPLKYSDPSGQVAVVIAPIVYAGAALIGGVGNLWSNWNNIKSWRSGLAYFASGAIGGAVSLHNPVAGGNITAFGNIAIDVLSGNVPKFNNFWDVAKYGAGKVLDGLSAAGAGSLAKAGYALGFNTLQKWGWLESYRVINGEFTTIASRTLERLAGYELGAEAANLVRGGGTRELAASSETFYRSMSDEAAEAFLNTGKMPAGTETFISPTKSFAENYSGNLFQINLNTGTISQLEEIGVRNAAIGHPYEHLPLVGKGWKSINAFFKVEKTAINPYHVNIGLGNGNALDIFNLNIQSFFKIN